MKFSVPIPSEYPRIDRTPQWAMGVPRYNLIQLGAHALFYVKHEYNRRIEGVRQPSRFFIRVESMDDYNLLMKKVKEQNLGCEFVHFYHIPWDVSTKQIYELINNDCTTEDI